MTQYILTDNYEWLKNRPDNSIDSIVTDSPYGLGKEPDPVAVLRDWLDQGYHEITGKGFMGKKWDAFVPQPILWKEVYRVLKPGGYLLSFFGTRTYDWGTLAIRLGGFEIRDQIDWIYGSGFPKSSNQSGEWEGWGTALKPAHEPIVVARKPLEGTVSDNLDKFATGAINIDACRVEFVSDEDKKSGTWARGTHISGGNYVGGGHSASSSTNIECNPLGRWPANVIHDGSEEVLQHFPDAQGQQGTALADGKRKSGQVFGVMHNGTKNPSPRIESDKSSARFFYCAKPSSYERNLGTEKLTKRNGGLRSNTSGQHITRRDGGAPEPVGNHHPTIKPIALMRYLIRLVTHKEGICLDLFGGSGTTGIAAELESIDCICLDNEPNYIEISEARANAWRSPLFNENNL